MDNNKNTSIDDKKILAVLLDFRKVLIKNIQTRFQKLNTKTRKKSRQK